STIENVEEAETKISGLEEGTYVFVLTVKDDQGATATDKVKVEVKAAEVEGGGEQQKNKVPVAVAGDDLEVSLPVDSFILDGSASYDSDGRLIAYEWKQKNGPAGVIFDNATEAKTQVTVSEGGTYIFTLTVTDNKGKTATDE